MIIVIQKNKVFTMFSLEFDINLSTDGLSISEFEKRVKKIYNEKLRENNLNVSVRTEISGNDVIVYIQKSNDILKKIPYRIVNGKLVVPKEYSQYLSKDKTRLELKDTVYQKIIQEIDKELF